MNFSSDNIQLFLAVLDRGSFSAAARALGRDPVLVKGARLDDLRISAAANLPALVSGRHGAPAPITAGDLAPA